MARGEPGREVPSRRVACRDYSVQIERESRCEIAQKVSCSADILERLRPPASATKASILDVPGSHAGASERGGEGSRVVQRNGRSPSAAVDHNGNRVRAAPFGQSKISELGKLAPVVEPLRGGFQGLAHDHVVVVRTWIVGRQDGLRSGKMCDALQLASDSVGHLVAITAGCV